MVPAALGLLSGMWKAGDVAVSKLNDVWMDLEIVILSVVSQTEKDNYHMLSLICGI